MDAGYNQFLRNQMSSGGRMSGAGGPRVSTPRAERPDSGPSTGIPAAINVDLRMTGEKSGFATAERGIFLQKVVGRTEMVTEISN